jgi:hypothetical protein
VTDTEFSQITYDVSDHVATITLSRPDKLNAFTGTMMRELIDAFDQTDADDDVRAVIVTGSGRGFCAGADLSSGGSTFARGGSDVQTAVGVPRDGGGLVSLRIFESTKPVIGAINGAAVGVGVTMTLPMDIRVAADTARFGFVFARRGIVPEACSSWFLPRIVVEVFRASGAGGQHINKTSSAVRLIHEPTGLVASSQEERSQLQNRERAMGRLTSLIAAKAEEDRAAELDAIGGRQAQVGWGSQIRSYVLQPYQMVKDLRTEIETSNVQAVLDGDIDDFVEGYLRWRRAQGETDES